MSDMPWFPFYVTDFTGSRKVRTMSHANVGRYVLLLCEQWEHGPLPLDMDELARLVGLDPVTMQAEWDQKLGTCFKETSDGFVNERLEEIREEQRAKAERLSAAGRIAGKASGKSRRHKSNARNDNERSLNDRGTMVQRLGNHSDTDTDTEGGKLPSTPIPTSGGKPSRRKRAAALPDSWKPNDGHRKMATDVGADLDLEVEKFRDRAKGNGQVQLDWDATFRNWLRRVKDFQRTNNRPPPTSEAGRVNSERPQSDAERTGRMEHVSGEPVLSEEEKERQRRKAIDTWGKEHADEASDVWRWAQDKARAGGGEGLATNTLAAAYYRTEIQKRMRPDKT